MPKNCSATPSKTEEESRRFTKTPISTNRRLSSFWKRAAGSGPARDQTGDRLLA